MFLKNNILKILVIILFSIIIPEEYSYYNLPIQENGRIKPLDTYSDNQLLRFYNKKKIKNNITKEKIISIDWFLNLITTPDKEMHSPVFNIINPDVATSLGLIRNENHKYSFIDIINGFKDNEQLINNLKNKTDNELTLVENQIIQIYNNVVHFDKIAHSIVCLLPIIEVNNSTIKEVMNIPDSNKVSYSYFMRNIGQFRVLLEDLLNTNEDNWTEIHFAISRIAINLQNITQYNYADALKIIPNKINSEELVWLSPWEILNKQIITEDEHNILYQYEKLFAAYIDGNEVDVNLISNKLIKSITILDNNLLPQLLTKESWYNKLDIFFKCMILYLFAFLIIGISWMYKPQLFRKLSYICILLGAILHGYGLSLRMIIMQRPPVSTLYESILFVSFILVIFAIIFEYIRKDSYGVIIASVGGTFLHFVGLKYASDGDTLGMLVAVLNSNFWLATHVTTITIGYGVSLVAGLMGHLYLIMAYLKPSNKIELKKIFNNVYGLTLMGLFFTMFGTILGGIWADQSWGRFWGWDPKENGALLIVLWHLMMLHLRISGMVKPLGFAFGVSLVNIVVVIAWFGVNLLGVGLHSYGFTDNVATNLFMFIFIELLFLTTLYSLNRNRKKNINI